MNSERITGISDPRPLTNLLTQIFEARTSNDVFEPGSDRVSKAVGILIRGNANYGDLVDIVRASSASGADPIVLLIEPSPTEIRIE